MDWGLVIMSDAALGTFTRLFLLLLSQEEKRVVIQPVALAPLVVVCMFLMTCLDLQEKNTDF